MCTNASSSSSLSNSCLRVMKNEFVTELSIRYGRKFAPAASDVSVMRGGGGISSNNINQQQIRKKRRKKRSSTWTENRENPYCVSKGCIFHLSNEEKKWIMRWRNIKGNWTEETKDQTRHLYTDWCKTKTKMMRLKSPSFCPFNHPFVRSVLPLEPSSLHHESCRPLDSSPFIFLDLTSRWLSVWTLISESRDSLSNQR